MISLAPSCSSLYICLIFSTMLLMTSSQVKTGNICTQGLGTCARGPDCNNRCRALHSGGQGTCDSTFKPMLCNCRYQCGPSPPQPPTGKVCYGGKGMCSLQCGDQCCNQKCAAGYKQGTGFCDSIGYNRLCKCQYTC
ncbi:hypothetical protein ACFE04_008981 [Oxalis oulophora]